MPQTTGGMSFVDARAEVSVNAGANYTDISGHMSTLGVEGGERNFGTRFTADGDLPIVGIGKRQLTNVKVSSVYTETAGEIFELLMNAYENKTKMRLRWAPKGFIVGAFVYTTSDGYIITQPYPGGDVAPGDIIMNEWTLQCGGITKSVQA